jgi:uncharacterized RDD family membrane protein YckC
VKAEEVEYVGFWLRFIAVIVDSALIMLLTWPVMLWWYGGDYWLNSELIKGPVDLIVSWLLPALLVVTFWIVKQATPGKLIIGAIIVDARTGNVPTTRQNIIRYLGYYLSTLPLCLGFLWAAFDARKQGWHDKLAGTVVVRTKRDGTQAVVFEQQG